ncbi:hypothetical protein SAMN05519104_3164 [Rhizobiales bacterium GAS188]|nr:hypothetical protein SAMN05519104_3164 [Rhizobiales bacterium GAS188]
MPNPNDVQLNPPGSWDKFEDICADLFSREWNDPNVVRYGRQGQRQHGVDILGKENGSDNGAQCKRKGIWPPTTLTKTEVDREVAEAKKFRLKLKKYIIATTAPNDARIIDHVKTISARHAKKGLFSVHVYSWSEIVRRIQNYPDLYEKHFDIYTLRQARAEIRAIPGAVAAAVERLQAVQVPAAAASDGTALPTGQQAIAAEGLAEALQRDFGNRFSRALERCLFPEALKADEFIPLAEDVLAHGLSVSQSTRRGILLRGARAAAIRDRKEDARRFLDAALKLAGADPDGPARARLAVAEANSDEAIRILRDAPDEDSRSALLNILATTRNDAAALDWLAQEDLTVVNLTPQGAITLCQIYLRQEDFDKAKETLGQITARQLLEGPYLYFLRGVIRFASVLPAPDRPLALAGLPLDVRGARPILGDSELSAELDIASNDLRQALPLARALGLQEAPRIIDAYLVWCDLLHPGRKQPALEQLRRDMKTPSTALSRIQFAFAYDREFDATELLAYLARRETLGGLSSEELRALLSIRLNQDDARGLAELVAKHRALAEESFSQVGMLSLEIQALAKIGDATSARIVLEANADKFDAGLLAAFRTEIAKAEGADPVAEHLKLYEGTKTTETLRALVAVLVQKGDHIGIARYAELLYADTRAPRDAAFAAQALLHAGDSANFVRVYEAYPFIKDIDPEFSRAYAWQLFRLGRLREAKHIADDLAHKQPTHRDLNLEIAVALETGEWEALAEPLGTFLEGVDQRDGLSLIRAANLSQASGQGPLMDLIAAAIKRDDADPNVLLGGYTLLVEEGLEETRPEAHEWFRKALALSGPDGPIQRFEFKELLAKHTEWSEHTRLIQENVARGDMPMVIASLGLSTTVIDIVLRNLIRNSGLQDARRRVAVPLFTGRRAPSTLGNDSTAAFDITTLIVLGWLGMIPKAFNAYPRIVLPAGVLSELFEGRRRIRQTQRSRLRKAEEIRNAIASGQVKVLHAPAMIRDDLAATIGIELAALLREAQATNGIVIRSAPVKRIGADDNNVDMSAYQGQLCDMHGLLKALVELNAVDEETEKSASQYFALQDQAWPASATPGLKQPLFLDGLTVVYLQTTGLLQIFFRVFRNVYIHDSTAEKAAVLIEYDRHVAEAFKVIDDVRGAIRAANAEGKVTFGPRRAGGVEADQDLNSGSTLNLLNDLSGADIVFFDDRFLNKEIFATDSQNRRAKTASTLDLIEELHARGIVDEQERRRLRYRLRTGGAMLMPVDASEIAAAARRNKQNESPEFRAIQDTLDLARLAEMPQFPSEMPWYIGFVHAAKGAIARIWNWESDADRAGVIARAILKLHPLAEDWIGRWVPGPPPGWIPAVTRGMIGSLCLPLEITDADKVAGYEKWLEGEIISALRLRAPETYEQVVGYLRELIQSPWDDDAED